ncbi:Possible glutaminyl transferase clustered with tetrahydromethanopterin biosynthesis genes [hydrothermal vent metagenome]|uniref:Possible glutaminyl transferase clustered with tetrahydromethanopterin biosynthesis genes n=1 Tax=hydrothermal vent metagenome TaxID=652676 RepID=A0A3B1CE59_9ZZZZ
MTVGILRSREGWHIDQLENALRGRGIDVVKFSITDLLLSIGDGAKISSPGIDLTRLNAIIVRIIPLGSMEQLMFRINALHRLENLGVRIINRPLAIEKTVDKSYTSHLLSDAGINTPQTVVCERFDDAMAAFIRMGDVVVKPLSGSCGLGIVRISDKDIAYRVFRTMEQSRFVYYIQKFVDCGGRSVRIFVINGKVTGAMTRTGSGWKANFSKQAVVAPREPSASQAENALRAAKILGLDYAGVDFLVGDNGSEYVIEVNGIPGWKGLQQTTGVCIAEKIIDCVAYETIETKQNSRSRADGMPA